jgi:hypothetical protein
MAFAASISLGEGDESLKERGILSLQVSAMQKREGASEGEGTHRKRGAGGKTAVICQRAHGPESAR